MDFKFRGFGYEEIISCSGPDKDGAFIFQSKRSEVRDGSVQRTESFYKRDRQCWTHLNLETGNWDIIPEGYTPNNIVRARIKYVSPIPQREKR